MQTAHAPLPSVPEKLKATAAVLTTYLHNRIRLMAELAKKPRDQHVVNTIRAYLHIVRSLEARYDLSPLQSKTTPERA